MDQGFITLPHGFEKVISQVQEQGWLITNLEGRDEDIHNPAAYIFNNKLNKTKYKVILDRNIFRFIVSAYSTKEPKQKHRAAISLICFCRASEICFEPNLALYERLLPKRLLVDQAIEELLLFYKIDNGDDDSLLRFSIGESDHFEIFNGYITDKERIKKDLTKTEWLTDWRSLYLVLLKLLQYYFCSLSRKEKILKFIEWTVKYFRLSFVCINFAIFLFSSNRIKNMMKFKVASSPEEKINQIYNMTWDLFFMNHYFKELREKTENEELMVATDDKVIRFLLKVGIGVQQEQSFEYFKKYLPLKEHCWIDDLQNIIKSAKDRVYDTPKWSMDYRNELIKEEEKKTLAL
ncbi:MAG: hypothetical protein M0P01_14765 [Treponema sp.]|nr:hypothetical protein [Treponema sp.]